MKTQSRIIVTARVEGRHQWPGAEGDLKYLASTHRHMFHWRAESLVVGLDREMSFEHFRADLEHFAKNQHQVMLCTKSCEQLANDVMTSLFKCGYPNIIAVECWEDGENGARVERVPDML